MMLRNIPVSEQRLVIVNLADRGESVTTLSRQFCVSRKTIYKWLARWRADSSGPLIDRSRRPHHAPRRTAAATETRVLEMRDQCGLGARKLRRMIKDQGHPVPAISTVHQVLRRADRVRPKPKVLPEESPQRFERGAPNQLWQLDHKGPLEINRARRYPLTIIDDHSRYLLAIEPCADLTMATTWAVIWDVFGQAGLPDALLCDNAYSTHGAGAQGSLTRFEAWLIRLDIKPLHGRPHHPQTQGKVERLHATYEAEMYPRVRRDSDQHFRDDAFKWRQFYNCTRPHQALDDKPPISRWRPSTRTRPDRLPEVGYPDGSLVRRCDSKGAIRYAGRRISVGEGLANELLLLKEEADQLQIFYAWKQLRNIPLEQLTRTPKRTL